MGLQLLPGTVVTFLDDAYDVLSQRILMSLLLLVNDAVLLFLLFLEELQHCAYYHTTEVPYWKVIY